MKKQICLFAVLMLCLTMVSCAKEENEPQKVEPQVSQMKTICELATMKCYYHNVAKYTQEDASGFWFWTKDRKFWVEYAGIVTIGIDTSRVNMEVKDNNVTITIPPAQVLSCKVDDATLTDDSFIIAKGSAKVEAEHQTEAFKDAQAKMQESASSDTILLANAQQRAQKLIEDYVNNIGNCVGEEYKITWIYLEDNGQPQVEAAEETKEAQE